MMLRSRVPHLLLALCFCTVAPALAADPPATQTPRSAQQRFATPEDATQALAAAFASGDKNRIRDVLGPGSAKVISSGDAVADRNGRERFLSTYRKQHRIEAEGDARAVLLLGDKEWPFPFPLLKQAGGWGFDAKSGAEEVLNRRIGRNELSAIQVCLAYVDAQRDYALTDGNGDGLHEYAMKLASTPGMRDGLYWPTPEGLPQSPLGFLATKAKQEGYEAQPYHGYFYRVLTSQGDDASGGAYDYVLKGKMMGGFALVAYPARWGASGVMTFIVNHDGVVYQRNLGRDTATISARMTSFNPGSGWEKAPQ